ncbi:MAG: cysteine--tRNA ligase [Fusobacteria bacterium]|nr:cysteine--tRNA ligase [Fusobacteriota bacterium]
MKIYNTLTGKLEEFLPIKKNSVSMYVCGPTVYNYIHIGNARPLIFFDTVRRYFEYKGYAVNFVQNFTDIDDKMIDKANEEGVSVKEIASRYIEEYFKDTSRLNIKEEGMLRPKATENISEMIELVKSLIDNGHAYEIDGDVYFDIKSYKDYGKLSHQKVDELINGARVEVNDKKRSPLDFTLWKKSKENEPKWDSPWGEGRPGWHIECSAMSGKYLGSEFDIHGGGQDLIFPHHENEIAQSVCANGSGFAKYWMHNGYINIKGEKMSKSKNNFFLLREILEKYSGNILRFFMLSSHYRKPIEFSEDELIMASNGLARVQNTLQRLDDIKFDIKSISNKECTAYTEFVKEYETCKSKFDSSMDDDFNTAMAIGAIFELVKALNIYIDTTSEENRDISILKDVEIYIKNIFEEVLGVKLIEEKQGNNGLTVELIDFLVQLRWEEKQNKNWALADKIRNKLTEMGINIKDQKDKTTWNM